VSDLTRYEKELAQELKNLPLPNEDAAWEDMSKLLDKDRDKGAPPPNWGNIALGSLMGAALLIALLWLSIGSHKTDKGSVNNKTITAGNTTNNNSPQANNNDTKSTVENNGVTTSNNNTTSAIKNDVKNNTGISNIKATNNNTINSGTTSVNTNDTKNNTENQNDQSGTNNTVDAHTNSTNSEDTKNNTRNNNEQLSTNNGVSHIVKNTNSNSKKNDVASNTINSDKKYTGNDGIRNHHGKNIVTANTVVKNSTNNHSNTIATSITTTDLNSNHFQSANKRINHNGYQLNNKKRPLNNTIARSTTKKSLQNADAIDNNDVSSDGIEAATTDIKEKKTEVKRINNKAHHTALAYHQHATAAVFSKKSHLYTSKKNTVVISKSKTKINISTAGTVNDDVEEMDTTDNTRLIKIGTAILAKKKAKHPVIKKDTANTLVAAATKDATKKKDEKKKQLNIAVGIAEQQAMRLTCDCIYPNDAYTKTSLATDYIPSVFVRIQPAKKWFVQAEFKYKAPQYLQEALYSSKVQNQPLNYVTTTSVLKKVYYNQVPLSFDYYIIPNWSVGVGVIYNNLAGHVSQQDVRKKMYGSANDSVISSTIVTNNSNDSNITITKNSFQGLIESQYQWKQLSFGVRYAIGLQSYLKYNDPTSGNTIDKKNDALTLFVRYDLWDPKRKRKKK
jgi:hypothetical protein